MPSAGHQPAGFLAGLGARVRVKDEGGYWKTRSVEKLREELRGYDSLVAAMSGVLKDVGGGAGQSADLDYKDFERLEHEVQSAACSLSRNLCSCNSCGSCDSCDSCGATCGGDCACGVPLLWCCRTDLLVGFRYYNLSDRVGIGENLLITQPDSPLIGSTIQVSDNFRARNDFYGSEFGLRTQIYRGRWSLEILTKIAMGNNHQTITIDGQTVVATPGQPTQTYYAGVLAGETNGGVYQRDAFHGGSAIGLGTRLPSQLPLAGVHWLRSAVLGRRCHCRRSDRPERRSAELPPVVQGGLPYPAFTGKPIPSGPKASTWAWSPVLSGPAATIPLLWERVRVRA